MRISDWSSDVCSSDLWVRVGAVLLTLMGGFPWTLIAYWMVAWMGTAKPFALYGSTEEAKFWQGVRSNPAASTRDIKRSEEHTSELQSLMRISYAVFCLKKKNNHTRT